MEKNIAIIPARRGSKGIKDKNIKKLNGKPLISYTIEAAIESGIFDCILVSTDSLQYAEIAKSYGAEVPFMRRKFLSNDSCSAWEVVKDTINQMERRKRIFDNACLLQPTSPLREGRDIVNAYSLLKEKKADSIISVCEVDHSPLWCNTLKEDLSLEGFISPDIDNLSRQELPQYYRVNGAIYFGKVEYLEKTNFLYEKNCYAYIMDSEKSIDIDTDLDFRIAEFYLSK